MESFKCCIFFVVISLVSSQTTMSGMAQPTSPTTVQQWQNKTSTKPITLSTVRTPTLQPTLSVNNPECPSMCTCDHIIRTVDCSSQGLNTIPSGISEYTTTLILDGNDFSVVTADAFLSVPNINTLSMKMCKIESIAPGAFDPLVNLQTLELQQNMITNLDDVLNNLENLQDLKVSQNKLTHLNRSMFANLRNLLIFEAHNNDISSIDAQTFTDSPSLTHLYLPNCVLNNLNEDTFKNLISLVYLDISGNINRNLGANIFKEMLQLKYLYLSNMELQTLDKDSFAQLSNLEVLSLTNNYLRTVTRDTFEHLTNLKYLLLADNQWNCTCPLQDFRKWERLSAISSDYPWKCHDPEFLRNSIALNVDEQQFGCEPFVFRLALENGAQNSGDNAVDMGKSVVLICEAVGDPIPSYNWTGPDKKPITTMNNEGHIYVVGNRLVINSVVSNDEGSYTCIAENSKGSHMRALQLRVTGTITEPPMQQCPLATLTVETVSVTDTTVTLRWMRSFGADAIGYFITMNVFGDEDSLTTQAIQDIETEEVTIDILNPGTDYLICVSVHLTGSCPSITTSDQCKQIRTTGSNEYDENLDSIEKKHTNELIGAAIATFLGTLLILASIFVIIWRYKMPREFTKYDFKITDDTTQFANMGDMPETSTGFQDFQNNEGNVTLVASFNNVGYDGKIDAVDEEKGNTTFQNMGFEGRVEASENPIHQNVIDVNDIHANGIVEERTEKGKKTNGIRVK